MPRRLRITRARLPLGPLDIPVTSAVVAAARDAQVVLSSGDMDNTVEEEGPNVHHLALAGSGQARRRHQAGHPGRRHPSSPLLAMFAVRAIFWAGYSS